MSHNSISCCIEKYIQDIEEPEDKAVARHLQDIISRPTHLEKETYKAIIKELEQELDKGKDFKTSFLKVCAKHVLRGNIIKKELPDVLTRIILNDLHFLESISLNTPINRAKKHIQWIVRSPRMKKKIIELLKGAHLASIGSKVVFATFDEQSPDSDPFKDTNLVDIINMLALGQNTPNDKAPVSAVKIRYKNRDNVQKRFPVFPDAGWFAFFHPSSEDDNYGRTKSLDPSLKNMPEIVHENLELPDIIVDIEFLQSHGESQ